MKFGIYEDYGNYTCAGYPGIIGFEEKDAQQFAAWNVDYVKLDGCYALPTDMDRGYSAFGKYLNNTGKPMVYSCSWPVYQIYAGIQPNFTTIQNHCNLWRNYDDIQDSWSSVENIIDYYGKNQDIIAPNAGPGHWNDPDMVCMKISFSTNPRVEGYFNFVPTENVVLRRQLTPQSIYFQHQYPS